MLVAASTYMAQNETSAQTVLLDFWWFWSRVMEGSTVTYPLDAPAQGIGLE